MSDDMPIPELYMDEMTEEMMEEMMMEVGYDDVPMGDYGTTADLDGAAVAGIFGSIILMFVVMFAVMAVMIVAFWKIFTKAGEEGWKSLIPFYNTYVLLEISGKPGWWLVWFFVPIANIVVMIMMYDGLSKSFGKGIGYTLGLIFLSPIFFLMLAFGSAKHVKSSDGGNDTNIPPQNSTPPQGMPTQTSPQTPQQVTKQTSPQNPGQPTV